VSGRGGELITANESTVMTKPLLDPVVVENGQGNGGLADSTGTNQGDWNKILGEIDCLLDQLVASEERSWRRGWTFSWYAIFKCKMTGPSVDWIADLVCVCATVSGHSVAARVRPSLTERCLLPVPSWFCTTVRWISETMARVLITSLRMSEVAPCMLLGKGGGDSPGALDTTVRSQLHF